MNKQIAMVATLGLILTVGALTTIYPQHALAYSYGSQSNGGDANGGNGGSNGVNPGWSASGQNAQGNDNSQGNEAGSGASGANHVRGHTGF